MLVERIATYGRMIKFSHSVFALPFAFSGAGAGFARGGRQPGPDRVDRGGDGRRKERRDGVQPAGGPRRGRGESQNRGARTAPWPDLARRRTRVGRRYLPRRLVLAAWRTEPAVFRAIAGGPGNCLLLFVRQTVYVGHAVFSRVRIVGSAHRRLDRDYRTSWTPRSCCWPEAVLLAWVSGFDIIYACQDVAFDREARDLFDPATLRCASWAGHRAGLCTRFRFF